MDGAEGGVGLGVVEVTSNFCFLDFGPGRYLGTSGSGAGEVCLERGCGSKGSEIPAKGSPPSLATWQLFSNSLSNLCLKNCNDQLYLFNITIWCWLSEAWAFVFALAVRQLLLRAILVDLLKLVLLF